MLSALCHTAQLHLVHFLISLQAVKDWMLVVVVCILVAIDVVFMIFTLSVPQLRVGAVLVPDIEDQISKNGVS